jgi:Gluconate 2-dehydrogenase subunit 3
LTGDPVSLPRQRRGVTPQMRGRYPDYDVLENRDHWDEVTRRVVMARVDDVPPIRFFTPAEARTLGAFCDAVMAQDDDPRIPVINFVDDKFFKGQLDGFQHAGMPDDRDVWRRMAVVLDERAREDYGKPSFDQCSPPAQHNVCEKFASSKLDTGDMDCSTAWSVMTRAILSAFYSHPWAWSEIGFGGPAYPRGYSRLGPGMREEWEGEEAFDLDPVKDTERRSLE